MFGAILAALVSVVPVYTNHNRVAGWTPTMTNIQAWAEAVTNAIAQGGGGSSIDTQAVTNIVEGYGFAHPSITNGLATKVYVDNAVASATPGDYQNVSNAALSAKATLDAKSSTWDGKADSSNTGYDGTVGTTISYLNTNRWGVTYAQNASNATYASSSAKATSCTTASYARSLAASSSTSARRLAYSGVNLYEYYQKVVVKTNAWLSDLDSYAKKTDLDTVSNIANSSKETLDAKESIWDAKQNAIADYTTTNAVCQLITNNVADWAMAGKSEPVTDVTTNNAILVRTITNTVDSVVLEMVAQSANTNAVAVLNEIIGTDWKTYGGGLGGLLAAILAAIAWLKNRGDSHCTISATSEKGVYQISDSLTDTTTQEY